jgi:hypothetical protein
VTELEVVGLDEFDVPCVGLNYETMSEEAEVGAEKKNQKENSTHLDVNAFCYKQRSK